MKNNVFQLLIIALLFPLLPACNNDDDLKGNADKGLAIVVNGGMTTRAVDADWESGDQIGLTMYNPAYTQMYENTFNAQYITQDNGEIGIFNPVTESETLYFPQNGDEIRLFGYYPYQADINRDMTVAWNVADQNTLQDIDLMTAEHTQGFSKNDPNVHLHFYHRLTKLIFNVQLPDGEDFVAIEDLSLTIKGAVTGATYNLLSGNFPGTGSGSDDIDVPKRSAEISGYWQAIVLPRQVGEGYVFEFSTAGGDTYIANMSADLELESGNQYTFIIRLERNPVTVSATIEPWVERDPISYTIMHVGTTAGASSGVNIGDVMNVYLQNTAGTDFDLLRTFTYESANNWVPDSPVYWEDIEPDPATFRASIIAEEALNNTQLPDILIADELTKAHYTGVDLTLRHALSKVIVRLTSITFDDDLNGATITMPDYLTGGVEEKGQFVPGTDVVDILVDRTDPANGTAIFQPQTIAEADPLLIVTINGLNYEAYQTGGFTFEPGVAYQITVTIEKTEVTVSVEVVDWVDAELELHALNMGIRVNGSDGVRDREVLDVFIGNNTVRDSLNQYVYSAALDTFASRKVIYWEDLDDPTTFYGSILRDSAFNSTQMNDYLVATPVTAYDSHIEFPMRHAGSRIMVRLTSNDGTFTNDELLAMDLQLPNYLQGGTMDNGVFVPGTTRGDIEIAKITGENGESGVAYIQPQTVNRDDIIINVISPTLTYSAIDINDIVFEQNVSYLLVVDLSETVVSFSAKVTDWTEDTVDLVIPALTLKGTLADTDDFFEDKSIFIYKLGTNPESWKFTYENPDGEYEWTGPNVYWDDQPGQTLSMTGVYYPTETEPVISNNTFPWNIGANQTSGYTNYDLLTSHLDLSEPQYANFAFTHATSQVQVNLEPGIGFTLDSLLNAKVVLNQYLLNGTVNLNTGVIGNITAAGDVIPQTITDGVQYEALVMPQTKAPNTALVTITLANYPNTPFTGRFNQNLLFTPGKRTIINVTLNKTEIELSATLADWVTGDTGNIIIE